MPVSVAVIASEAATRDRLAGIMPADGFTVATYGPAELPSALPSLFVIALPGIETPEEQLIERLRADEATASIPIVIASALPMVQLQSVPYASDWTIAIVEEPVKPAVLADTIAFLLSPGG